MKIGVFIPHLPNNLRKTTIFEHLSSFENVFLCVPNGMQGLAKCPAGVKVLPIGGDIVTARNNIMRYAQQHGYDAIWVVDDDLNRFVSIVDDKPTRTKFTPYYMNCRMGGVSNTLFMKDKYERYAKQGRTKTGIVHGMMYFEDFSLRYRDRSVYGHEDCDLYLRMVTSGYEPVIDTAHFRSFPNNSKLSLTQSNDPIYDWLMYREWGDIIEYNKYMSGIRIDKTKINSSKTHTKYPTDIEEFYKLFLLKNKRSYNVSKLISKVSKNLRVIS